MNRFNQFKDNSKERLYKGVAIGLLGGLALSACGGEASANGPHDTHTTTVATASPTSGETTSTPSTSTEAPAPSETTETSSPSTSPETHIKPGESDPLSNVPDKEGIIDAINKNIAPTLAWANGQTISSKKLTDMNRYDFVDKAPAETRAAYLDSVASPANLAAFAADPIYKTYPYTNPSPDMNGAAIIQNLRVTKDFIYQKAADPADPDNYSWVPTRATGEGMKLLSGLYTGSLEKGHPPRNAFDTDATAAGSVDESINSGQQDWSKAHNMVTPFKADETPVSVNETWRVTYDNGGNGNTDAALMVKYQSKKEGASFVQYSVEFNPKIGRWTITNEFPIDADAYSSQGKLTTIQNPAK